MTDRPTLALGSLPAISARVSIPERGAWFVDVDLDVDTSAPVPSGRAVVRIGGETLTGTVYAPDSGRFGARVRVRVVGGSGGWYRPVRAQHWANDAGVPFERVVRATAAEVGETIATVDVDARKTTTAWGRIAGLAADVFQSLPWYVDAAGETHVGAPRSPVDAPKDVEVLEHDPARRVARLSSVTIPWPGWRLTAPGRSSGLVVRGVEAKYGAEGATVTATVGEEGGEDLLGLVAASVGSLLGTKYLAKYRYRVVGPVGDRIEVQAIATGAPDVSVVSMRPGIPGVHAMPSAGAVVVLTFADGSPSEPYVSDFEPVDGDAFEAEKIDVRVKNKVKIGEASVPVVLAPSAAWFAQVTAAANAAAPGSVTAPAPTIATKIESE